MMILTEQSLIFKGIRPLQKLGAQARDLALNNPLADFARREHIPDGLIVVPPDPWAGDAQRGRDMIAGVFRFAGHTIEKDALSWMPESASPEWIAELHGFEWLRDLRSVGGDRARRLARELAANWLDRFEKPCDTAWDPDTTGVRLASWISFHDFFCASADDDFRRKYFSSLVQQSKYLMRRLPGDLQGLPLMRALKGLAYSGLALDQGRARRDQAYKLILQQVREQLLPDGGHVSRSPQDAFAFLQVLVDLRTALTAAREDMPEEIQHAIDRIAPAVKFFRHGDGALCQFNGGQEGNANICDATLMHSGARGKAMKSLPHSGYERLQLGRSCLVMDTGTALMSKYSERAHAGLLSFEYSYGRDRVIVNCGSSSVRGRWRDLLRATAAHATAVLDNRNACSFGPEGLMGAQPEVSARRQEDENIASLEATHKGYVPRFGATHARDVVLRDGGETLAGHDRLTGKSGVAFAVRFHLHPGIQASLIKEGTEVLLRAKSGTGWRFRMEGACVLSLEDSVYAGEGEVPRRTVQIVLSGMTQAPATDISWEIRREKI